MEIFNDKKILSAEIFLHVITKNLNWEILAKSLVTFKRWDGVKDEKFYYLSLQKNQIFKGGGGGFMKNQYIGGDCLRGVAFLRGGLMPQCTL